MSKFTLVSLLGFVILMVAELHFGRMQWTYISLSLIGWIIVISSVIGILFKSAELKSKYISLLLVIVMCLVKVVTGNSMKRLSFKYYLLKNKESIDLVIKKSNDINNDFTIRGNRILSNTESNNDVDWNTIKILLNKVDSYILTKNDHIVYLGLYGMLDVRIGLVYHTGNQNEIKGEKIYSDDCWYWVNGIYLTDIRN